MTKELKTCIEVAGNRIEVRHRPGRPAGAVWLGGFRSDMVGTKAALALGPFLAFNYGAAAPEPWMIAAAIAAIALAPVCFTTAAQPEPPKAHPIALREQFEQSRNWVETTAERVAGRRLTVESAQGAAPAAAPAGKAEPANAHGKRDLKEDARNSATIQAMLEVFPAEIRDVEEMEP